MVPNWPIIRYDILFTGFYLCTERPHFRGDLPKNLTFTLGWSRGRDLSCFTCVPLNECSAILGVLSKDYNQKTIAIEFKHKLLLPSF